MPEQYESLGEKTKQIDISLKYTGGDIVKAKEMAAGRYLDVIAMKGKFIVAGKNVSGVFIAFFNYIQEYVANVSAVLSSRPALFEKTRIFDDWKTLYRDLNEQRQGPDVIDSQNFIFFLSESFLGYDIFPDVQEHNLDALTETVKEIIGKSFNDNAVKCQIELENTSSLALELGGVPIHLPGEETAVVQEIVAEDERIAAVEREAKYLVEAKAVLAPVRGRNVSDIAPGDRIKVLLTGTDVVSEKVVKLMRAFDENGNRLPVVGRVKAKIPFAKGGYMIYAVVAKGVFAKIFEEENVKILLDVPQDEEMRRESFIDKRLAIAMGVIVGLIVLCGIILLQIL